MSLLETLKQRKAKADELMLRKPFSQKQMELYQQICKQIYLLEVSKMLTTSAPMTMDPKKIQNHQEVCQKILVDVTNQPDIDLKLKDFVPEKVDSYKKALSHEFNRILSTLIKQGGNDND